MSIMDFVLIQLKLDAVSAIHYFLNFSKSLLITKKLDKELRTYIPL